VDDGGTRTLEHEAFVYGSDDEYVATLAPLLAGAVMAGDVAVAVVPDDRARVLRTALGPRADAVRWIDRAEWYRHPVRTIAAYEQMLRQLAPGTSAVVVGEVCFGDTEHDHDGWTRHEAAVNRALERHPVRLVCPYDARSLPSAVVEDARRTHPHLRERHARRPSGAYVPPEAWMRRRAAHAGTPAGPPDVDHRVGPSVRDGRQIFAATATAWGLPAERVRRLSVGVSEVLTNAVIHGGGGAWLRIWCRDDTLTCVVEDEGEGSDDPLLGYLPPPPAATSGYGLWLTRQLFDRVELLRSPRGGLLVLLAVDA
jgi:anti-sigma regulatory factor (Ser/Thr protein kinase)